MEAKSESGGMLCPVCRVDLVMSERQGVEIDYCPKCRGVWLDRGELDKIIEKASERAPAQTEPASFLPQGGPAGASWGTPQSGLHERRDSRGWEERHDEHHHDRGGRRHGGWLDRLLD